MSECWVDQLTRRTDEGCRKPTAEEQRRVGTTRGWCQVQHLAHKDSTRTVGRRPTSNNEYGMQLNTPNLNASRGFGKQRMDV